MGNYNKIHYNRKMESSKQNIAIIHITVDHTAERGIEKYKSKKYTRNKQTYDSANKIENSCDVETELNVGVGEVKVGAKNAVRTKFSEQNSIASSSDREENFEEEYTKTTMEGGIDIFRTETFTIRYTSGGCFSSVTKTPVNVGKYKDYPPERLD